MRVRCDSTAMPIRLYRDAFDDTALSAILYNVLTLWERCSRFDNGFT